MEKNDSCSEDRPQSDKTEVRKSAFERAQELINKNPGYYNAYDLYAGMSICKDLECERYSTKEIGEAVSNPDLDWTPAAKERARNHLLDNCRGYSYTLEEIITDLVTCGYSSETIEAVCTDDDFWTRQAAVCLQGRFALTAKDTAKEEAEKFLTDIGFSSERSEEIIDASGLRFGGNKKKDEVNAG